MSQNAGRELFGTAGEINHEFKELKRAQKGSVLRTYLMYLHVYT